MSPRVASGGGAGSGGRVGDERDGAGAVGCGGGGGGGGGRVGGRCGEEGARRVVHRSRGRPSNRGYGAEVREQALGVYRERLEGFGPALAREELSGGGGGGGGQGARGGGGLGAMACLWRCTPTGKPST